MELHEMELHIKNKKNMELDIKSKANDFQTVFECRYELQEFLNNCVVLNIDSLYLLEEVVSRTGTFLFSLKDEPTRIYRAKDVSFCRVETKKLDYLQLDPTGGVFATKDSIDSAHVSEGFKFENMNVGLWYYFQDKDLVFKSEVMDHDRQWEVAKKLGKTLYGYRKQTTKGIKIGRIWAYL